jgi:hypothetical protein
MTALKSRSSTEIIDALYAVVMAQEPTPTTEDEAEARIHAMLDADESLFEELRRALWLERLPRGRPN